LLATIQIIIMGVLEKDEENRVVFNNINVVKPWADRNGRGR